MNSFYCFIALTFFVGAAAAADDERSLCSGGTTQEEVGCWHAKYVEADKQLNSTYQGLLRAVSSRDANWTNDLRTAQRKWIEYRDLNCEFYSNYFLGGSAGKPEFVYCKLKMTEEREAELRNYQHVLSERGY